MLKLHFNEDDPDSDSIYGESKPVFRDVSISEEKITPAFADISMGDLCVQTYGDGYFVVG